MIQLEQKNMSIIIEILSAHAPGIEIRAFGSRVNGSAKEHSDLDLVLISDSAVEKKVIHNLREAFETSDLPFRVDIVDWNRISPEFRGIISKNNEKLS